jgi:predicted ribosome quality control (RQC) complex YloA/Tae2 family protein
MGRPHSEAYEYYALKDSLLQEARADDLESKGLEERIKLLEERIKLLKEQNKLLEEQNKLLEEQS